MGLSAVVYKSLSDMEKEFPKRRFQREPETGECETVPPDDPTFPWEWSMAQDKRIGNIALVGHLREVAKGSLGPDSHLERLVLYSGSHAGDVIKEDSFAALLDELATLKLVPAEYVEGFVQDMRVLIEAARREQNPIVFV